MSPSLAVAEALLRDLGAPSRRLTHVRLVGEAADVILAQLQTVGAPVDADFVRVGVLLHDAGKILHPEDVDGPGSQHEPNGERLLVEHGGLVRVFVEVVEACELAPAVRTPTRMVPAFSTLVEPALDTLQLPRDVANAVTDAADKLRFVHVDDEQS